MATSGRPIGPIDRSTWLSLILLAYSTALAVFLLVPPFLRGDVGPIPHFTGQELVDLFTSLVTMPLLGLAMELTGRSGPRVRLVLLALVAGWVAGQGIHLAANAIGDIFPAGPERDAFYATAPGRLDEFLDEQIGHWLWLAAWAGLVLLLLATGRAGVADGAAAGRGALVVASLAGALHGLTAAIVADQAGTWPLTIPFAAALLPVIVLARRADAVTRVVLRFVGAGAVALLLAYVAWGVIAGWPPVPPCARILC